MSRPALTAGALAILTLSLAAFAAPRNEEPVDLDIVNRIRAEGLHRSQVMETLEHLCDVIGPRLTGSPSLAEANEWTRKKMEEWGMTNAHLEEWGPFGRGWEFDRCAVHLIEPRGMPLLALPKAWTPGTDGPVRGEILPVDITKEADFEKYAGKLEGKILMLDDAVDITGADGALFTRRSADELEDLCHFPIPEERTGGGGWRARYEKRQKFRAKYYPWLVEQGVVATVSISSRNDGILRVMGGGSREADKDPGPPALLMAQEHYNTLMRMHERDQRVVVELDVGARFHDENPMQYNTVAEIEGAEHPDEVVLLGAHLDSWHAATGATDNGAGVAVVMEAARIISTLPRRPRRTVRVGLWTGEEQGLLGSKAYVERHLAYREDVDEKAEEAKVATDAKADLDDERKKAEVAKAPARQPLIRRAGHDTFCAYFNIDNGSGRIRGVYSEENSAVKPIFEAWFEPFRDIGVNAVTMRRTGGTDHQSFDRVGLPGFQFVQDKLDYSSRTHHTNLDVYDRAVRDDMVQAATVLAAVAFFAADREEPLPRKPFPDDAEN